jgi:hypothetical protein
MAICTENNDSRVLPVIPQPDDEHYAGGARLMVVYTASERYNYRRGIST